MGAEIQRGRRLSESMETIYTDRTAEDSCQIRPSEEIGKVRIGTVLSSTDDEVGQPHLIQKIKTFPLGNTKEFGLS